MKLVGKMKLRFAHIFLFILLIGVIVVLFIFKQFRSQPVDKNLSIVEKDFIHSKQFLYSLSDPNKERWKAAYELATFLSEVKKKDDSKENTLAMIHQLINESSQEDSRIRQYLVLTLGVIADPKSED